MGSGFWFLVSVFATGRSWEGSGFWFLVLRWVGLGGILVSGFWFPVSGFAPGGSWAGVLVSGFWFLVMRQVGLGRASGVWLMVSGLCFLLLGRGMGFWFLVSGFWLWCRVHEVGQRGNHG